MSNIKENSIEKIKYIKNSVEMADIFRAEGKIFVVILIIIIILIFLFLYIIYIDRKISELKNKK